jgi:hypothetical protein
MLQASCGGCKLRLHLSFIDGYTYRLSNKADTKLRETTDCSAMADGRFFNGPWRPGIRI